MIVIGSKATTNSADRISLKARAENVLHCFQRQDHPCYIHKELKSIIDDLSSQESAKTSSYRGMAIAVMKNIADLLDCNQEKIDEITKKLEIIQLEMADRIAKGSLFDPPKSSSAERVSDILMTLCDDDTNLNQTRFAIDILFKRETSCRSSESLCCIDPQEQWSFQISHSGPGAISTAYRTKVSLPEGGTAIFKELLHDRGDTHNGIVDYARLGTGHDEWELFSSQNGSDSLKKYTEKYTPLHPLSKDFNLQCNQQPHLALHTIPKRIRALQTISNIKHLPPSINFSWEVLFIQLRGRHDTTPIGIRSNYYDSIESTITMTERGSLKLNKDVICKVNKIISEAMEAVTHLKAHALLRGSFGFLEPSWYATWNSIRFNGGWLTTKELIDSVAKALGNEITESTQSDSLLGLDTFLDPNFKRSSSENMLASAIQKTLAAGNYLIDMSFKLIRQLLELKPAEQTPEDLKTTARSIHILGFIIGKTLSGIQKTYVTLIDFEKYTNRQFYHCAIELMPAFQNIIEMSSVLTSLKTDLSTAHLINPHVSLVPQIDAVANPTSMLYVTSCKTAASLILTFLDSLAEKENISIETFIGLMPYSELVEWKFQSQEKPDSKWSFVYLNMVSIPLHKDQLANWLGLLSEATEKSKFKKCWITVDVTRVLTRPTPQMISDLYALTQTTLKNMTTIDFDVSILMIYSGLKYGSHGIDRYHYGGLIGATDDIRQFRELGILYDSVLPEGHVSVIQGFEDIHEILE